MMVSNKPVFVIVPGASQNPAHYGLLSHLLMQAGYGVVSGILPSVGARDPVSAEDDAEYVRKHLLLPTLDVEKHNVVMVSHSYSSVPASYAARGLGKADRKGAPAILGQIFIASLLPKGGDGKSLRRLGGSCHRTFETMYPDANLLRCDDVIPPLYPDVPQPLADAAVAGCMAQGRTSFMSPCPRATWDAEAYKGRCVFIRTLKDTGVPIPVQDMMIEGAGIDWIVKDIDTAHNPQLVAPEKLAEMLLDLAKKFEEI